MFTDYYGLGFNPFNKQNIREKDAFHSADHRQMQERLEYLKTVRGIGVFTARPGMGKTYALRCFMNGLNPNQYQTVYICLSTVICGMKCIFFPYVLLVERIEAQSVIISEHRSFPPSHNRLIRRVNRDATIHLESTVYDAPMQFIGQKVEVRFLPGEKDSAYILYGGEHYPLRLTDRVANGQTKRASAMAIDYGKEGMTDVH